MLIQFLTSFQMCICLLMRFTTYQAEFSFWKLVEVEGVTTERSNKKKQATITVKVLKEVFLNEIRY